MAANRLVRRTVAAQKQRLADAIKDAEERLVYWMSQFKDDDALELEYFAHGMEGVVDLFQDVANEAGHLAELIDPEIGSKV